MIDMEGFPTRHLSFGLDIIFPKMLPFVIPLRRACFPCKYKPSVSNYSSFVPDLIDERNKSPACRRMIGPFLPKSLLQQGFFLPHTVIKDSRLMPDQSKRYQCPREGDRQSWLNKVRPQALVAHTRHICQKAVISPV